MPNQRIYFEKYHGLSLVALQEADAPVEQTDDEKEKAKYSDGYAGTLAKDKRFEIATICVILLNAVGIGVDADYSARFPRPENLIEGPVGFIIAENFFATYFTFEILVRFFGYKVTYHCLCDAWFVFDACLVFLMVLETWVITLLLYSVSGGDGVSAEKMGNASILRVIRLLRLTRMARVVRLMRAVPELMTLVKGMWVATRSMFFTLCLLMIFLYGFGIAFTQLARDFSVGAIFFPNVPASMNTLLLHGTFLEDCPRVINLIGDDSFWLRCVFLLFVLVASLTVMNMLVGVIVEVVSVVSSVEKESMRANHVKACLLDIIADFRPTASRGAVSRDEFMTIMKAPGAAVRFKDFNVDITALHDHIPAFFENGCNFNFPAFLDTVMSLRGHNTATVKDMVDMRKFLKAQRAEIDKHLATMEQKLQRMQLQQSKNTQMIEANKMRLTEFKKRDSLSS